MTPEQQLTPSSTSTYVTRFAPSPTGRLHRGHAFSALCAHTAAREAGGRFLLRVEDIDLTRCRPEFEAGLLDELAWLGISWEQPVRRQSEHFADYHAALSRLADAGLVYRCFRTRREALEDMARAPHGPGEEAAGRAFRGGPLAAAEEARRLAADEPYAWRLSLDEAARQLGSEWGGLTFTEHGAGPDGETGEIAIRPDGAGDIVLGRKDVGVAYHLAVVVDDALQGVTEVVRGCDLHPAAHVQVLLQALLDLPTPDYRHHRLLGGPDGRRLAKRDRAETLQALRQSGVTAEALKAELGFGHEKSPGA